MRNLKYYQALNEGLHQLMASDPDVMVWGQGCTSPWYVGGICKGLAEKYSDRVVDTPVSESVIAGATIGMAVSGLKPIMIFPRQDFAMYAMDAIVNQAPKINYMFGGRINAPLVYILITNHGNSQGCQHSQDFTWLFEQIPGLKIINPKTPYEVKGAIITASADLNPVIFIDNRDRYEIEGEVPKEMYTVDILKEAEGLPMPASQSLEKQWFERYGR